MKKLSYLILLTLLVLNNSCSKDEDNPETWTKHKFKVTLSLSGDYEKYDLLAIMSVSSTTKDYTINTKTGEKAWILSTDLTENFYEFESVNKTINMQIDLADSSKNPEIEVGEANVDLKIYLDDELLYQESMALSEHYSVVKWLYYDDELQRSPKI